MQHFKKPAQSIMRRLRTDLTVKYKTMPTYNFQKMWLRSLVISFFEKQKTHLFFWDLTHGKGAKIID